MSEKGPKQTGDDISLLEDSEDQIVKVPEAQDKLPTAMTISKLEESNLSDESQDKKKLNGMEEIQALTQDFNEMIEFMDFSFETAFQQKDNEFMVAYREHIRQIQEEIDKIRNESNDEQYIK
jgi:chromosome segregation ATPase